MQNVVLIVLPVDIFNMHLRGEELVEIQIRSLMNQGLLACLLNNNMSAGGNFVGGIFWCSTYFHFVKYDLVNRD